MEEIRERIRKIRMLLLDVDGVMTDGGIILGPGSMELKRFHVRDGMGISQGMDGWEPRTGVAFNGANAP